MTVEKVIAKIIWLTFLANPVLTYIGCLTNSRTRKHFDVFLAIFLDWNLKGTMAFGLVV